MEARGLKRNFISKFHSGRETERVESRKGISGTKEEGRFMAWLGFAVWCFLTLGICFVQVKTIVAAREKQAIDRLDEVTRGQFWSCQVLSGRPN